MWQRQRSRHAAGVNPTHLVHVDTRQRSDDDVPSMTALSRPTFVFDHVSVSVSDADAGAEFYREVLGFEPLPRPPFEFPGAWFQVGGTALHLTTGGTIRGGDAPLRPNDPHLAVAVHGDLDAYLDYLRGHGLDIVELADSPAALRQTFVKDPWGNVIEFCVNFSTHPDHRQDQHQRDQQHEGIQ